MALEPYKQKDWLYHHYVQKRMNLKDIVALLEKNYGMKITPQAVYNWLVKYDLPRYRGKGRKIGANMQRKGSSNMGKRPDKLREERMRAMARAKKKNR
jgi:hypothetical protein